MNETMIVRGFVATEPSLRTLESGLHVVSFRLGSTPRRFDKATSTWVDGETSWYTVSCFRELAVNAQVSLKKGQPVIVLGRLKVRQFSRTDGSPGVSVELDAETLGHDLRFGAGTFGRTNREQHAGSAPGAPGGDGGDSGEGGSAEDGASSGQGAPVAAGGEGTHAAAAPDGAGGDGGADGWAPGYAGPPPDFAVGAGEEPNGDDDALEPGVDLETGEITGVDADGAA